MKDKQISRKAVFSFIGLTGLLTLVFGGGGYLGLFSRVTLETMDRGPYAIMGLEYKGPYRRISHKLKKVINEAKAKKLTNSIGMKCAILYDDPKVVKSKEQRSLVGFISKKNTSSEKPDFIVEKIGRRRVLVAKIEAYPSVALFKSYPKIKRWLKKNNLRASTPMLEIYYDNGLVELEIPIISE